MADLLIISKPQNLSLTADYAEEIHENPTHKYRYIVLPVDEKNLPQAVDKLIKIKSSHPESEIIILAPQISPEAAVKLNNSIRGCHFIKNYSEINLNSIRSRLKNSSQPEKGKERFFNREQKVQSQHAALTAVHKAESITEIETHLFSTLGRNLDLAWVKIFFYSNDNLDDQLNRIKNQALFKAALMIGSRNLGRIVFARNSAEIFSRSEEESLKQVAESVTMALDRLAKLDQAEVLKQQWESTFDAISEPLCLTDDKFQILRTNRAFLKTVGLRTQEVLGVNCFSAFCGSSNQPTSLAPSPNSLIIQRQSPKLKGEVKQFEVKTQRIQISNETPSILLILFRDITDQIKIEKQIFESAKMAELGTIGSSIAHDINNPLGGMISFLQLIKMDLPPSDPMYDDVLAMEAAGKKCKEIVENLLRFSRKQEASAAEAVDLRDVVVQATKIIELQTKSIGIDIDISMPKKKVSILGHFNLLSQALNNIFQNAYEAVAEKLKEKPGEKGEIKVELSAANSVISLIIFDNGIGISPEHQNKIFNPLFSTKRKNINPGLGLTLAYQIIQDHNGQLEIFSQPKIGTSVKISFINV